jgi:hypothetical protein
MRLKPPQQANQDCERDVSKGAIAHHRRSDKFLWKRPFIDVLGQMSRFGIVNSIFLVEGIEDEGSRRQNSRVREA